MEGEGNTLQGLRRLHPEDPNAIPEGIRRKAAEWASEVEVDEGDVHDAVASAPEKKSEDAFGWKAEHLKALLASAPALAALVSLFLIICRGALPNLAAAAMAGARLVALNKPDNAGIRPIGVPLVWRRVAGRIFNLKRKATWKDSLCSLGGRVCQFVVGWKSGSHALNTAV